MNRRSFMKLMGAGAGAAVVGADVLHALASPDLPPVLSIPADADTRDAVAHVLNRIGYGPLPGQVDAVKQMGVQAYLEQQLNYSSIDDSASEARLNNYITLDMSLGELLALGAAAGEIIQELDSATLLRAVYSPRQLYEVMVNFWSEHFSIWIQKDTDKYLKTADDRDVIRKYPLGKFRDLLGASAKSPAMLIYLDNAESVKAHPNENYAREVMELHTCTIGNYTEDDVKEVARCFTGWSLQGANGDNPGTFIFNAKQHDDGQKVVMGHTIPAGGGIKDGETVLDILAAHPGTSMHLASKLCRRFIGDVPPDNVVQAAADTFMKSGGDIPAVLRTIFAAPEFTNAAPKFKRPWEYMVSLLRGFNAEIPTPQPGKKAALLPLSILQSMGQLPFDHITPDGYTDYASLWVDTMMTRWNTSILAAYNTLPGVKIDLKGILASQKVDVTNPRNAVEYFANQLLGRPLTQPESDTLWGYATAKGDLNLTTDAGKKQFADTVALIAASPAFMYR